MQRHDIETLINSNQILEDNIKRLRMAKLKQRDYYEDLINSLMLEHINLEKNFELQKIRAEDLEEAIESKRDVLRGKEREIKDLQQLILLKEEEIEFIRKDVIKDKNKAHLALDQQENQFKNELNTERQKISSLTLLNEQLCNEKKELLRELQSFKKKKLRSVLYISNESKRNRQKKENRLYKLTSMEKNKENIIKDIERRKKQLSMIIDTRYELVSNETVSVKKSELKPLEINASDLDDDLSDLGFESNEQSPLIQTDSKKQHSIGYKITNFSDEDKGSYQHIRNYNSPYFGSTNTFDKYERSYGPNPQNYFYTIEEEEYTEPDRFITPKDVVRLDEGTDSEYVVNKENIIPNTCDRVKRKILFKKTSFDKERRIKETVNGYYRIKGRMGRKRTGFWLLRFCLTPFKCILSTLCCSLIEFNCCR